MATSTETRGSRGRKEPAAEEVVELVPPPRQRRRPLLIVAAIALICLGALLAAWAWTASSGREVLALRQSVWRGQQISDADLVVVRVSVDPAVRAVGADQRASVVGQYATADLAQGGLLVAGATGPASFPQQGKSVIGVQVSPAMMPAGSVKPGDSVRLVLTPGAGGAPASTAPPVISAVVTSVTPAQDGSNTVVNVQLASADAAMAASRAATGKLAVVVDPAQVPPAAPATPALPVPTATASTPAGS